MGEYKFFPFTMNVSVTENVGKKFIQENITEFLDWLFLYHDHTAKGYLDDHEEQLSEFLLAGGAEQ